MVSIFRKFSNQLVPKTFKYIGCRCITKIESKSAGLLEHEKKCKKIKSKINMKTVKEKIAKVNKETISVKDHSILITEYLYLIENDEEIDFLAKYLEKEDSLGTTQLDSLYKKFLTHLFYLNKVEKFFELKDKTRLLDFSFQKQLAIINLMYLKRYKDVVKMLDSLSVNQKLYSIRVVSQALLLTNTIESFEKIREIISQKNSDFKFIINPIINIVLLAVNQKQYEFAYEFLKSDPCIDSNSSNIVIQNLKSIVLSNLNRLDESLAIIENILLKENWYMYDLEKKFFKLTLNTFQTSAQNNEKLLEKFKNVYDKIIQSNQLNEVDLFELTNEYHKLKRLKNCFSKTFITIT